MTLVLLLVYCKSFSVLVLYFSKASAKLRQKIIPCNTPPKIIFRPTAHFQTLHAVIHLLTPNRHHFTLTYFNCCTTLFPLSHPTLREWPEVDFVIGIVVGGPLEVESLTSADLEAGERVRIAYEPHRELVLS